MVAIVVAGAATCWRHCSDRCPRVPSRSAPRRMVSIALHPHHHSLSRNDRVNSYDGNGSRVSVHGACAPLPPVSVRACMHTPPPPVRPADDPWSVRASAVAKQSRRHTLEVGRLITRTDRSRKSRRPILRGAGTPSARAETDPRRTQCVPMTCAANPATWFLISIPVYARAPPFVVSGIIMNRIVIL